jgi:hypothetical protein
MIDLNILYDCCRVEWGVGSINDCNVNECEGGKGIEEREWKWNE